MEQVFYDSLEVIAIYFQAFLLHSLHALPQNCTKNCAVLFGGWRRR